MAIDHLKFILTFDCDAGHQMGVHRMRRKKEVEVSGDSNITQERGTLDLGEKWAPLYLIRGTLAARAAVRVPSFSSEGGSQIYKKWASIKL